MVGCRVLVQEHTFVPALAERQTAAIARWAQVTSEYIAEKADLEGLHM
jgi:hypothetical protein